MKKTHAAVTGEGSALGKYRRLVSGSRGWGGFAYYECCLLLTHVPGALGLALRRLFWPRLFAACGRGCVFGFGLVLRHPGRIRLGEQVVISERCVLDGRHETEALALIVGDRVMLSNDVMLSCKNGTIRIGNDVGINAQSIVQSTSGCPVEIGNDCILGQRCLVIGGGSYQLDRFDLPIRLQGIRPDGGVRLEDDVWLGAGASVLGGVTMGQGSVAGAGAVVTRSMPARAVCLGVPARVVRRRGEP